MSLSRKIAAAVGEANTVHVPARAASAEEGPHRMTVAVDLTSPVGLQCEGLEFATGVRPDWSLEDLRDWGGRLAARLTYLMEPLVVLEADPVGHEVALRSQSPSAREGVRTYYELRLSRPGALRLDRVAFDESTRQRRPVPFQMTREILIRLADDLVASVA